MNILDSSIKSSTKEHLLETFISIVLFCMIRDRQDNNIFVNTVYAVALSYKACQRKQLVNGKTLGLLFKEQFTVFVEQQNVHHKLRESTVGFYKSHDRYLAGTIVNSKLLEWTTGSFVLLKTPGLDGVSLNLLQKGIEIIYSTIIKLLRTNDVLKTVPKVWSKSKIAFILKHGRNEHIMPRDVLRISLTSSY